MKTNCFKSYALFLLLLLGCRNSYAQLSAKLTELRSNVIYLEAFPKDDPGNLKDGFGFISGQEGSIIYLLTAQHTLDFSDANIEEKDVVIKIQFFQSAARHTATIVRSWPKDDLALLSVSLNTLLKWKKDCGDFKPAIAQKVSVIGSNKEWISPGEGPITSFKEEDFSISFTNNSGAVLRGTSGGPLINEKGIVGMVRETEGTGGLSYALSLSRISALLANYPNVFTLRPDGSGLVYLAGGIFEMGSIQAAYDARIVHKVELKPFYLMPFEVSFEEYEQFCQNTQRVVCPKAKWNNKGKYPVLNVAWSDAIEYCNWRSEQANLEKVYTIGSNGLISSNLQKNGYRLPTEAEWEYAARGGEKQSKAIFGNGKDDLSLSQINYKGKDINKTWPVDQGDANVLGLHNMSGNVAEWCEDYYSYNYYQQSESKNPQGPELGAARVIRGGAWNSKPDELRIYARRGVIGRIAYDYVGFRLARNAE